MQNKKVKVACYYPWVYLRSGVERTILEVVLRSRHSWTIYTNHYDSGGTFPEFQAVDVVELPRISVNREYMNVIHAGIKLLSQKIPLDRHDVLVNHSEGLGDLILFRNHRKPIICYSHLPLLVANVKYFRDLYLKKNPYKGPLVDLFGAVFRTIDRLSWKYYSHIFATSETVREMLVQAKLANREKILILHPGIDCHSIKQSNIFEKYFLAFSRLKWQKNIELAINGFKNFIEDNNKISSSYRLIVAGQVDEGSRSYYKELIMMAKGYPQIHFIPNPNAEEVKHLYRYCYAVINTTVKEAWGIIPLEANAYGKPVIAVNQGGPTEHQINGLTGFLTDATPEAFGLSMTHLANNEALTRKMGMCARKNVLKYDWQNHVNYIDSFLDQFI
jgi:glycosyltransferase involved in cell wall biosynthesis